MSFYILNPADNSPIVTFVKGDTFELVASRNVFIEKVSFALVPHHIKVQKAGGLIMLIGIPEFSVSHSLWVSPALVEDGFVTTFVFNISDKGVRVGKGEIVSKLVAL